MNAIHLPSPLAHHQWWFIMRVYSNPFQSLNFKSFCFSSKGYPPFYSTSGQAMSAGMKKRIRAAQFEFPQQEWRNVSDQAKDLIRNLLQVDPAKRMTIDQLSVHSWVSTNLEVPHTPLCTAKVLKKDEEKWREVQEEMQSALAAMRVDTDVQLKQLHLSENGLLAKRKNRKQQQKLEITAWFVGRSIESLSRPVLCLTIPSSCATGRWTGFLWTSSRSWFVRAQESSCAKFTENSRWFWWSMLHFWHALLPTEGKTVVWPYFSQFTARFSS